MQLMKSILALYSVTPPLPALSLSPCHGHHDWLGSAVPLGAPTDQLGALLCRGCGLKGRLVSSDVKQYLLLSPRASFCRRSYHALYLSVKLAWV